MKCKKNNFNTITDDNITFAIIGPVSAGKSTFLNALCSNTYSDMKRKKTTMLPQIYNITKNTNKYDTIKDIYDRNKQSNNEILKLRENNEFKQEEHFKEIVHSIKPLNDFIEINNNYTYSILDMPGLNCGNSDNMYFNYIEQNKNIDVYILIFDINSGLNTTSEIEILNLINCTIKKNNHGFVHIILNKCDDFEIDNDGNISFDDEIEELYQRSIDTVNKIFDTIDVSITPLCSSKLYVYRVIKYNIETIDENQLNNIIKDECGKSQLKKLDSINKKKQYVNGLINSKKTTLYNEWMRNTGYDLFRNTIINKILNEENISLIKQKHLIYKLNELSNDENKNITKYLNEVNLLLNELILITDETNIKMIINELKIKNITKYFCKFMKQFNYEKLLERNILFEEQKLIINKLDIYTCHLYDLLLKKYNDISIDNLYDYIKNNTDDIFNYIDINNDISCYKIELFKQNYDNELFNDLLRFTYNDDFLNILFESIKNTKDITIESWKEIFDFIINNFDNDNNWINNIFENVKLTNEIYELLLYNPLFKINNCFYTLINKFLHQKMFKRDMIEFWFQQNIYEITKHNNKIAYIYYNLNNVIKYYDTDNIYVGNISYDNFNDCNQFMNYIKSTIDKKLSLLNTNDINIVYDNVVLNDNNNYKSLYCSSISDEESDSDNNSDNVSNSSNNSYDSDDSDLYEKINKRNDKNTKRVMKK